MKLDNSKNNKNNINKRSNASFIKKAFTLIELVVVIAVIAILAGVGVATYFAVNNSANRSATEQNLVEIQNVYSLYKIEKEEEINDLSLEDSAYNFISSYLPSQGITNRDTDLINYIVLKRKTNNDDLLSKSSLSNNIVSDEKIVYVTTKPSYGYFIEEDVMSGDRLENTKIFDNEEDMIKAIQEDERFSEYNTSFLNTYGIEASKELQDYDLNQDGIIQEDEIGRKAIEVEFTYKDKDYTYYLKNGESIVDCDIRYLNGTGNTIFGSKGTLNNTITPFDPYGIIDDGNSDESDDVKLLFNENITLTKDDIANATPIFKSAEEATYLYNDDNHVGSLKQYEGNIFVNKSITLKDIEVDVPKANLANYEACFSPCGGSERLFGDFKDCVDEIVKRNSEAGYNGTDPFTYSSSLPDYDIYIGQKCIIDEEITLPKNVKVKVNYNITRYGTYNIRDKFQSTSEFKKDNSIPAHLIIKAGGKLTATFEGNNREGDLGDWAHSTDAALSVFSRFYDGQGGIPMTYSGAGIITIEDGGEIVIKNGAWFRAFGLVEGDGKVIVETGGNIIQNVTTFDWVANGYYQHFERIYNLHEGWFGQQHEYYTLEKSQIFLTQKFTFNNVFSKVELKPKASFIGWIPLKFKQDYGSSSTRDIYITFIGDINSNAEEAGDESTGKINKKSLFGIEENNILISRIRDTNINKYHDFDDLHILNSKRNEKIVFNFNSFVSIGDLKLESYSIKDFWYPLYNSSFVFNAGVDFGSLKIKVLPGSSIVFNDFSEVLKGTIVTYDRFDYFKDNDINDINPDLINLDSEKVEKGVVYIQDEANAVPSSKNMDGLGGNIKIKLSENSDGQNLYNFINENYFSSKITTKEIESIEKIEDPALTPYVALPNILPYNDDYLAAMKDFTGTINGEKFSATRINTVEVTINNSIEIIRE